MDMGTVYDFVEAIHMFIPVIAVLFCVLVIYCWGMSASNQTQPPSDYLENMQRTDSLNARRRAKRSEPSKPSTPAKQKSPTASEKGASLSQNSSFQNLPSSERDNELRRRRNVKEKGEGGKSAASQDQGDAELPEKEGQWITPQSKKSQRQKRNKEIYNSMEGGDDEVSEIQPAAADISTPEEEVKEAAKPVEIVKEIAPTMAEESPQSQALSKRQKRNKKKKGPGGFLDDIAFAPDEPEAGPIISAEPSWLPDDADDTADVEPEPAPVEEEIIEERKPRPKHLLGDDESTNGWEFMPPRGPGGGKKGDGHEPHSSHAHADPAGVGTSPESPPEVLPTPEKDSADIDSPEEDAQEGEKRRKKKKKRRQKKGAEMTEDKDDESPEAENLPAREEVEIEENDENIGDKPMEEVVSKKKRKARRD